MLAGQPLDFCMLTSSLSTVLGRSELRRLCRRQRVSRRVRRIRQPERRGDAWMSVDWDGWRFDETDSRSGDFFLTPREGAEAFRRILPASAADGASIVSTGPSTIGSGDGSRSDRAPSAAAEPT